MQLRDYQEKSINDIRRAFQRGKNRVCFQLPTGGGKTVVSAFMIKNAVEKGHKVLFLVHLKELIHQTSEALRKLNIEHGIIAPKYPAAYHLPVQIGMVQTLTRRKESIDWKPTLIITDECQHCCSNTYLNLYAYYPEAKHVGLSATPQRLDGKGLKEVYDCIVKGPKVKELMDRGYLSDYKLYSIKSDLDLSKVKTMAGDYNKKDLDEVLEKSAILGDAVKHYKKLIPDKKALVFCVSIKHSKATVARFQQEGISAAHIDGTIDKQERDTLIQKFRTGEIKVLSNCSLISEGFDVPDAHAVIMLRPTQSLTLYLQSIGRALRPSPNKTAVILDHVGNYARHGLPDEDREWTLEGRKKRKSKSDDEEPEINIVTCENCFVVYNSKEYECPNCGHVRKREERKQQELDGDLEEIDKEKARKMRYKEQAKAQTLDDLVALGKQRGYKNPHGWAKHLMAARMSKHGQR